MIFKIQNQYLSSLYLKLKVIWENINPNQIKHKIYFNGELPHFESGGSPCRSARNPSWGSSRPGSAENFVIKWGGRRTALGETSDVVEEDNCKKEKHTFGRSNKNYTLKKKTIEREKKNLKDPMFAHRPGQSLKKCANLSSDN